MQHSVFENIKSRVNIVEVAEMCGLSLKRSGRRFVCCCPVHADDTPSCTLYPEDGTFYCFGCGAHGDCIALFQMSMRYETPLDAAHGLATLIGMQTDNYSPPPPPTPDTVTVQQMRQYLRRWQRDTFRELLAAKNDIDTILSGYDPGNEDMRFHTAVLTRAEIEWILDELAAPDEGALIEIYEEKGRDINAFIANRRRALQSDGGLKARYSNSAGESADTVTGTSSRSEAEETAAVNH